MIIELPESFLYKENSRNKAYVVENILVIEGNLKDNEFEKLMYQITYATKDTTKCFYCGKEFDEIHRNSKYSLDHMYSKSFGGISLPCNLVPACIKCNQEKNQLTANQYICWKNARRRSQDYLKKVYLNKNKSNSIIGAFLPAKWITIYPSSDFSKEKFEKYAYSSNYKNISNFYEKYKHYLHPAIMTLDGKVLWNGATIHHAINNGVKRVPIILLENVIVKRSEETS